MSGRVYGPMCRKDFTFTSSAFKTVHASCERERGHEGVHGLVPEHFPPAVIDWAKESTDELVAALWCAGPVPREAIVETERRLRARADT